LEQRRWSPAMHLSPFMTASSSSDKVSCRCKRPVVGLPAVPVAPGASSPFLDRNRRSDPARRWLPCRDVRLIEQRSSLAGLSALLVALFEFSLGVWLVVKGFNSSAIASLTEK